MPIGKNAIKRVENNGYSKVKSTAPDMENSNVIANLDPQVAEKLVAPVEKATKAKAAKPTQKKTAEKTAPVKSEAKAPTKKAVKKPVAKKDGFNAVSLGADMPYYLL